MEKITKKEITLNTKNKNNTKWKNNKQEIIINNKINKMKYEIIRIKTQQ